MTFDVKVRNTAASFIAAAPEKSRRIIRNALEGLAADPFPGSAGNKERIVLRGDREIYRLHIARTYTAFYSVDKEGRIVRVHEILPIEQAHKRYGRL